jgi:bifunctional non-homologous end joining protein LigD
VSQFRKEEGRVVVKVVIMPLDKYIAKRDFHKTPEPKGELGNSNGFKYLIQKHAARRLHYDFRLELDNVLKSWAVTRGPSLDPHDKRLAVEVEDHPVEYGSFEGTIPKGQYGGGTVMLWDTGTWEPVGDPHKELADGKLTFRLHGKRLQGEWSLIRMKGKKSDKDRNNWLLLKRTDEYAVPQDTDYLLEVYDTSVVSGRTMEEIASANDAVWQSKREEKIPQQKKPRRNIVKNQNLPEPPKFIAPQLATLEVQMPKGEDWVHEIKFDGYRLIARINNGAVQLFTRTGKEWTVKFPTIAKQLKEFPVQNAILDGEVVVVNEDGATSFKALQDALTNNNYNNMQYYLFDLLFLDGEDMRRLPLIKRKKHLREILADNQNGRIFYSEHFEGVEKNFLQNICSMHLEGVVSKLKNAPYTSTRSKTWIKSKCSQRQEFVIVGFTNSTDAGRGIGALLLATYKNGALEYSGKVGSGFDYAMSADLRKKLEKLQQKKSALKNVTSEIKRGTFWVEPKLVCEVKYSEVTPEGRLRHPVFEGLREDKPAGSVHFESPVNIPKTTNTATVAGIKISHPDRVLYPESNITKLQVVQYYEAIAPYILPYISNRALSIIRCTDNASDTCFFQKHIGKGLSKAVHQVHVKKNEPPYVMVDNVDGLVSLAQMGMVELHPWGSDVNNPNKPNVIIFDLDPDLNMPWKEIVSAAQELQIHLRDINLESFVKVSGGKGVHITVPIKPEHYWDEVKSFTKGLANIMMHDSPAKYTSNMSKAKRKGRIFIDYLRNDLGATAIAPYSLRARKNAPVALPISWDELNNSTQMPLFLLTDVLDLVQTRPDPWAEFFNTKQSLDTKTIQAFVKYAD